MGGNKHSDDGFVKLNVRKAEKRCLGNGDWESANCGNGFWLRPIPAQPTTPVADYYEQH